MFFVFSVVGVVAYGVFVLVGVQHRPHLQPHARIRCRPASSLLLIIGVNVSLGISVQRLRRRHQRLPALRPEQHGRRQQQRRRRDRQRRVLLAGYSASCSWCRDDDGPDASPICVYRLNAYQVFPALSLRPSLFRCARLREVTGFSVYVAVIDWSNKLNYSIDAIIIGAYHRRQPRSRSGPCRSGSPRCCSG